MNKMKEQYQRAEIEVVEFEMENILTDSREDLTTQEDHSGFHTYAS